MTSNRKKILFILPLPPPVHGSTVVGQAIRDSKRINAAFDCRFVSSTFSRDMGDLGAMSVRKIFTLLKIFCLTLKHLIVFRPHLCYFAPTARGIGFYKDLPIIFLLKIFRRKIVYHFHNKGVAAAQDRWIDDKLYRFAFRGAKVILLSERLYGDVAKYFSKDDVFICPNGIPDTESENFQQPQPRNNPVPRLLFLSNLLESKGVFVLLDALKILKDNGYSFVCDFVGAETPEINAARFAEETLRRGLNEIVVYKGKQYGDEKDGSFRQSDIFVFPTFYKNETFGLVNLEAMRCKLPVISTNEGGIPDVVKDGETGFVVEKENVAALSDAIAKLIDDCGLRKTMGEKGFQHFINNFTIEKFEGNLNDILTNINTKKGGG
ncbi:MAG: glycosyltransferase family 4 protein [Dysgonamonadaceae bacterium]|jgi:glycosyltransferase involved in cell wall biosynthesis|nr:glycosyltransferase family 4 protein [Dysgonamonadaceae bacterium]